MKRFFRTRKLVISKRALRRSQLCCKLLALVFTFLLSTIGFTTSAFSQECGPEAAFTVTVVGDNLVFQPVLPQTASWDYVWAWEDSNGNIFEIQSYANSIPIPVLPEEYVVRLGVTSEKDAWLCVQTVNLSQNCENAGFTPSISGCCVYFDTPPLVNLLSNTWNFGDGTPETNVNEPLHCYDPSGTYDVSHAVVFQGTNNPSITYVQFCSQRVTVSCTNGFTYQEVPDCCRLQICFQSETQNGQQTWDFGDGTTSNAVNPCHYYTNLSTFPAPNGTPSVTVTHTVIVNGAPSSHTHQITFSTPAIYLGSPGATTNLNTVVSSITNAPMPQLVAGTLSLTKVNVAGELIVDKSWTCNGVQFCMNPAAGMRVNQTRTLTFGTSAFSVFTTVNNAPDCAIWRSIDLLGHATIVSNRSVIGNALYGLRTTGTNPTVRLTRTTFRNNFIGMYLRHNIAIGTFNNNIFISDGTLAPLGSLSVDPLLPVPYLQERSFSGIFARNIALNIPDVTVNQPLQPNSFIGLANGIWTENCNDRIRRCSFAGMVSGAYGLQGGVGIRFNDGSGGHSLRQWGLPGGLTSFSNCRIGVSVANGGPNTFIRSEQNVMNPVGIGYDLAIDGSLIESSIIIGNSITATGSHGIGLFVGSGMTSHLNIWNNLINIENNGIGIWLLDNINTAVHDVFVHSQEPFNNGGINLGPSAIAGIELDNFSGAEIQNNNIEMDFSTTFPRGIFLAGSDQNNIGCNIVTGGYQNPNNGDASWGLRVVNSQFNDYDFNQVFNTWEGINFDLVCGGSNLRCSWMTNHRVGLHYTASAQTGVQIEHGNRWMGNWVGSTGALHDGLVLPSGTNNILSSEFFAALTTDQFPPSISMPNNFDPLIETWFQNGAVHTCAVNCDDEASTQSLGGLENQIATTGIVLNGYEAGYRWLGDRYLYKKLKKWPALASSSLTMQSYLNSQATAPLGKLWEVENQTVSLYGLDNSQVVQLSANFSATEAALAAIEAIDLNLAEGVPATTEATLLADRENLVAIIDNHMASNQAVWDAWMNTRTFQSVISHTYNSGISTAGDYDGNEKALNEIYLQTEAKGLPVLLSHKNTIKVIAEQCALEGGDAVYRARAWYAKLKGIRITEEGCVPTGGTRGSEAQNPMIAGDGELAIYPNPTDQDVHISYRAKSGQTLCLFNHVGMILRQMPLVEGANEVDLALIGLPSGVYYFKVLGGQRFVPTAKLVIQ